MNLSVASRSSHPRRRMLSTGLCVWLFASLTVGAPSASAATTVPAEEQQPPELLFEVTQDVLADAVTRFDPDLSITTFEPDWSIEDLGGSEPEEEDVIVLETDILFAAMEWELPGSAGSKIGELVEEISDGAAVEVNGHTDSNPVPQGYDFDNHLLSENRAEAVAEVLGEERPDLQLSVQGFGEDQPAVEEDEEDPGTFAANRRVEIRYD